MKKAITIVFCLISFYLFVSPTFTSSIVFGQELKACADVRKWEYENYPMVVYTPYPIDNYTYSTTGMVANFTYLVQVTKPKDNIDVRLKIRGPLEFDFTIKPFFGKNPEYDKNTNEWIINDNITFAIVSWNPQGDQIEITASDDRIFVNAVPKEYNEEFLGSLYSSNLFLTLIGNKDLHGIPLLWNLVTGLGMTASSMINKESVIYPLPEGIEVLSLRSDGTYQNLGKQSLYDIPGLFKESWLQYENGKVVETQGIFLRDTKGNIAKFIDLDKSGDYIGLTKGGEGTGWNNVLLNNRVLKPWAEEGYIYYAEGMHVHPPKSFYYTSDMSIGSGDVGWTAMMVHDAYQAGVSVPDHLIEVVLEPTPSKFLQPSVKAQIHILNRDALIKVWEDIPGEKPTPSTFDSKDPRIRNINPDDVIERKITAKELQLYEKADTLGIPAEEDVRLAKELGTNVINFEYYRDISFLTNQIMADLSLDPSSPAFKQQIELYLYAIRDLKQNIPPTLSTDLSKQNIWFQELTDAEVALSDLSLSNEFDVNKWMLTNEKMSGLNRLSGSEFIDAYKSAINYLSVLNTPKYIPSTNAKIEAYEALIEFDTQFTKIDAFINDGFNLFIGRILRKSETYQRIADPINQALSENNGALGTFLRTFTETTLYLIFQKLGSEILNYGVKTPNQIASYIGIAIQWYFTIRYSYYMASFIFKTAIQAMFTYLEEGVLAATVFAVGQLISFFSGLILSFIIGMIFEWIWCLIFPCPTQIVACDTGTPWYTDYHFKIKNSVVHQGDIINYIFYGTKNCYPTLWTFSPVYSDVQHPEDRLRLPTVDLYGVQAAHSYCTSTDGRCFDCSANVVNPSVGQWYVDANLVQILSENNANVYRYAYFNDPATLLVCPIDKHLDQSEKKCVSCDIFSPDAIPPRESCHNVGGYCDLVKECQDENHKCDVNPRDCTITGQCCCIPIIKPTVSGRCEEGCGASPECDEKNIGYSWCEYNIQKTCDSNCQLSEEQLTTPTDSDSGIDNENWGVCQVFTSCQASTNLDRCVCYAKDSSDGRKVGACARHDVSSCEADTGNNCYWALQEWYPSGSYCQQQIYDCSNIGPDYKCYSGRCTNCIGDINGDRKVDMKDIAIVAKAFGSVLGSPNYNPKYDLTGDGKIDMKDIAIVAKLFGKRCG